MAMNFPDNPSNGDTITFSGKEYVYTSADSAWSPVSNHDALPGFVANEHIDWTLTNVANIHADNYTDTDTLQSIAADATDATQYITFVPNTTGAQAGRLDAGLTYNPSTNNLIIGNDVTVGGNLIINGTQTTVNSTTVTIDDPVFTVGGDTAPTADDNKDRGIEFNYFDTAAKVGFFGFDDSTGKFTFIPDATNSGEVFAGTTGEIDAKIDWNNLLNIPVSANGTNLGNTADGTSLTITSSTGTNTALPAATASTWGVMTDEMFDAIEANTLKETNVSTNLGYTTAASTGTVTSSDGTNATLPAATISLAGLLTGADKTKLDGIETAATADQTGAQIKTAYEAETSAFTDAQFTKLSGIEASADVTDTTNVVAALTAGTNVTIAANGTISSVDTTYSVGDGGLTQNNFTNTDHTRLNAIETGATADQTGAEIKAAYEAETSAFTDAQFTKLAGIEASATADQTGAQIKTAYEAETSAFTDAQFTKLAGIEASATADQTGAQIKVAYEAETSAFTDAQFTKLSGIETAATADQTAAEIRVLVEAATNSNVFTDVDHTKLNAIEASADVTDTTNVVAALTAGTNVTIAANGTISSTDTNTTYTVGDGGLTQNNFTNTDHTRLNGIETGATADQTAAEIRVLVEAATDSNVFTDADHTKLNAIEASADVTDTTNVVAALTAGTNVTIAANGTISSTDTNTTYTSGDFNHDALTGFVAAEHVNWAASSAGTIHLTNLPATALTSVQTASSQAVMLALTTQEGDVVVRSDELKTYMHNGGTANTMADFTLLASPTDAVTSVDGATGVVTLNHDSLTGFVANEHIDWTLTNAANIHAGNYTNTTYNVGDGGLTQVNFTTADNTKLDGIATSANNYVHPSDGVDPGAALTGASVFSDITVNAAGHVTGSATRALTLATLGYTGATNANNYSLPLATSTVRGGIELFSNTDQATAPNAVTATASRTYGLQLNAANQAMVNVPWTDTNTVYTHPTFNGDDFSLDTGALTGATVISDIDINVTTDTNGHVTDANGTVATRTLTLANLGYTGATNANNYSLPLATNTVRGGIELFNNTDQSVAANTVTTTASRTYGLQLNAANQGVINVPWTDTNTTYSVGDGGLTEINFTSADNSKLGGIETAATADQTFDQILSKTSGTGDYSTSGNLESGRGSGGVALTINDGQGNANVTFNHAKGIPEQLGHGGRIVVNTDNATVGAQAMTFELGSAVTAGVSYNTTEYMRLNNTGLVITGTVNATPAATLLILNSAGTTLKTINGHA